jgi:serine/threonine protein kinase
LGQGAFGKVYLGMHTQTGQLIAVKQVSLEGIDSTSRQVRALEREIAIMQQLRHENIVQYFGSENTGQTLNIFMEYVPGGSISSLLQRFTRFSESVVRTFTAQILSGLQYIHSCNMVHRGMCKRCWYASRCQF